MDNRTFPDITFVDADTQTILDELVADYERTAERKLYPADPVRVLLLFEANVISHERAIMNRNAKQNVPRYAKGAYLDSLSEIFRGITRLGATSAKTTFEFVVSEPAESAISIPKGTRISADGIVFATDEECVVGIGETTAQVAATCEIPGTVGNGFLEGQITNCVDIFPYFEAVANITESSGGTDTETDEELYQRMRESVDGYSTAGAAGAYIYHAKSASNMVGDVAVFSPLPGEVDIRVLCKDGTLPTPELLEIVEKAVSADEVRPLTDHVTVSPPNIKRFDIDVKFYITSGDGMSISSAEAAVAEAVDKYISWQTEKIGRDITDSYLTRLIMEAGVKRVEVISPAFEPVGDNEAAQLGTRKVVCGGYEDE